MTNILKTLCFLCLPYFAFSTNVDSLLSLIDQSIAIHDHQEQIKLKLALGKLHFEQNNYEQAVEQLREVRQLSASTKGEYHQQALLCLGKTLLSSNQHTEATEVLEELVHIIPPKKREIKAKALQVLSKTYSRAANYELSHAYNLNALSIWEAKKDTMGIIECTYQMGSNFFYQGNYNMALDYYFKTKDLAEKIAYLKYIYNSYAAIGGSYSRLWETEKSITYNLKSLAIAEEMDYEVGIAYTAQNIGANYYAREKYDSATIYFERSLEIKQRKNDVWGSIASLQFIGNSQVKQHQLKKGLGNLNQAMKLAVQIKSTSRILECHSMLADAYRLDNNLEQSYQCLRAYIHLKDSVINNTTQEKLAEAQTNYEVLKKETELSKKEQEIESLYKTVLIIGLIILIFIIWVIYKRLRLQFKTNTILSEKNQQINEQLKKLEQSNHQLEASNAELEQFAFIASHDLKEPLRNIGSYASLLKRRYQHQLDKEGKEFLEFITNGVSKMYHLLDDVLLFSKIKNELNTPDEIQLDEIIHTVKFNLAQQIKEKKAIVKAQNLPTLSANSHHLVQVFQNLISNGIQYANEKPPIVHINCKKNEKEYIFSVMDNGMGINMEYKDKIFEIFQRLNKRDGSSGTGIGLAICKKIISNYGGVIWVESELGKGSTFYFTFPI